MVNNGTAMGSDPAAAVDASKDDSAQQQQPPQHRRVTSEAASIVQQILLEQQQQQQEQQQTSTSSTSPRPRAMSSRNLFQQVSSRQIEKQADATNGMAMEAPSSTAARFVQDPSLAETAAYLTTLHEQETTPGGTQNSDSIMEQEKKDGDYDDDEPLLPATIQDASPLDRVTLVGDLLKEAAALGNTSSTNTNQSNGGGASGGGASAASSSLGSPQARPEYAPLILNEASTSNIKQHHHHDNNHNNDVEQGTTGTHVGDALPTPSVSSSSKKPRRFFGGLPSHGSKAMKKAYETSAQEWVSLTSFFKPKSLSFCSAIFYFVVFCLIPIGGVAAFLFYQADNPPTGRCSDENPDACNSSTASISWWLLFLGVRQVIAMLLAKAVQVFWIDFCLLQHPFIVRILGPRMTLIFVQSRGWPAIVFFWSLWNLVLLYGRDDFSDHWLYKQDHIGLFNQENPAGSVTTAKNFRLTIIAAVVVSIAVSLKRYWIGLHLGARMYARYNERLKKAMNQILLVSEVALWAKTKKREKKNRKKGRPSRSVGNSNALPDRSQDAGSMTSTMKTVASMRQQAYQFASSEANNTASAVMASSSSETGDAHNHIFGAFFGEQDHSDLSEQLVKWEEPSLEEKGEVSGVEIIEFRNAFTVLTKPFFFSTAFGSVNTRQETLISAEHLFRRLVFIVGDGGQPDEDVAVNLMDMTSMMFKGCKKPEQLQHALEIIDLLKPDANGCVTLVDFASAIDEVYREIRSLEHAVKNHSHVERSYEKVLNILFYILLFCVVIIIFGFNPLVFIASISAIWLSFAFMIGSGVSQQFEGILMVLIRQPYDVGDSIAIANSHDLPDVMGSKHWQVLNVDLVTTVAKYLPTGEVASFSNGALARMRIFNMNDNSQACVRVLTRFSIDVPYSTILIFRAALEKFINERPQEWDAFLSFRAARVEMEMNFIEYVVVAQHRNKWQDVGPIFQSKAELSSFCVELQKVLGCHYKAPPMGVELSMKSEIASSMRMRTESSSGSVQEASDTAIWEIAKQFEAKKDD